MGKFEVDRKGILRWRPKGGRAVRARRLHRDFVNSAYGWEPDSYEYEVLSGRVLAETAAVQSGKQWLHEHYQRVRTRGGFRFRSHKTGRFVSRKTLERAMRMHVYWQRVKLLAAKADISIAEARRLIREQPQVASAILNYRDIESP
jgi:hypothetical protein